MSFESWVARTFGDREGTGFGSGWTSGVISVFLGALPRLPTRARVTMGSA